ncbi:MAG: hypothetical protein ACLTMR_06590 [Faecalibacillus sp.]
MKNIKLFGFTYNKKIHGLTHNVKTVSLLNPSLKKIYYLYTSKYILTTTRLEAKEKINYLII